MPYVGNPLANAFSSREKQDLTGQSGTSFTLTHSVSSPNDLSVYINHVRQEPTTAYSVNGTTLTTTGSVAGTDDFYIIYDELAVQSISHPANQALTATAGTFTSGLVGTTGTFSGALSGTTGTFSGATTTTDLTINQSGATTPSPIGGTVEGAFKVVTSEIDATNLWDDINSNGNNFTPMPSEISIMNVGNNTTNSFAGLFMMAGETYNNLSMSTARIGAIREGAKATSLAFATRESNGDMAEKLRITSTGNVGIGVTDPSQYNSYGNGLVIKKTEAGVNHAGMSLISATSGYGSIHFADGTGNTTVGVIEYYHNDDSMMFATGGSAKFKIQENGTHIFTMKAAEGGANTAIWGSGNNSYIQAVSGELYARDSAGNNNLISPHNFEYIPDGASETHAWAFLNKKTASNIKTEKDADGKDVPVVDTTEAKDFTYVNVDMMKVVREVEKLTGTKLVYTGNQDGDDSSTVKDNIIAGLIKRIEALESK